MAVNRMFNRQRRETLDALNKVNGADIVVRTGSELRSALGAALTRRNVRITIVEEIVVSETIVLDVPAVDAAAKSSGKTIEIVGSAVAPIYVENGVSPLFDINGAGTGKTRFIFNGLFVRERGSTSAYTSRFISDTTAAYGVLIRGCDLRVTDVFEYSFRPFELEIKDSFIESNATSQFMSVAAARRGVLSGNYILGGSGSSIRLDDEMIMVGNRTVNVSTINVDGNDIVVTGNDLGNAAVDCTGTTGVTVTGNADVGTITAAGASAGNT